MEKKQVLAVIKKHFEMLKKGQSSHQEHVFTEEEARTYAENYDIPYPGSYVTPSGELIVPPALIFMKPAKTFGITDSDAPAQAKFGIYTQCRRQYFQPALVGHNIIFDGKITDTYIRRGYYYIAVEWEAKNEEGKFLSKGTEWHTLGFVREET